MHVGDFRNVIFNTSLTIISVLVKAQCRSLLHIFVMPKEIVIATDQCSRHEFNSLSTLVNLVRTSIARIGSHDWSGCDWITVYCRMTYTKSIK